MKYLCFRVDYNHTVGGGHLQRCLNIANSIKLNTKFIFIVETNINYRKDIHKILKNHKIIFLDKFNPKKELKVLSEIEKKYQDVTYIFDICNSEKIKKIYLFIKYINDISFLNKGFFIDGNKKESMIKYLKKVNFKGVISPYFVKKNFKKHYQGLEYFVFNPNNKKEKVKKTKIKKLLISFGNSDPKNITELVLKSLSLIKKKYHIDIIIGPMFKNRLIQNIKTITKNCKNHIFSIKKNIRDLSPFLMNCDFAFVSCGLTKFEAILHKKPCMVIPLNYETEIMSEILKKKKLIFLTKNKDNLTVDDLTKKIHDIFKQKKTISILKKNCSDLKLDNKNQKFLKVINFY
jgi:spore coat polysaccharide biosynthesis predicted glycosyltransferase SpsG